LIDLHLHTTASDGLLAPAALVTRAGAAGLSVLSVTDHDTLAGLPEAADAARHAGLRLVAGIEITAVEQNRDVHILGYFFDPASPPLLEFLRTQRADRVRRVREIGDRLHDMGFTIDVEPLLARAAEGGRSVGRPAIADALVATGQIESRDDAFARLLARGKPAYVPRHGAGAAEVIGVIHSAGGIASLAHPGVLGVDDLIPVLAAAELDAIEVWHSDHDSEDEVRYRQIAGELGLGRSGGSDYHGEGVHRACRIGSIALPSREFAHLEALAEARR
jgi:predicted metal-dependent phosphoesterase TrpH